MSTYNKYNEGIENSLGNSSEIFFEEPMKKEAVNWAVLEIAQMYAIQSLSKKASVTSDADGLIDYPSDYMRMIRLFDSANVSTKYEYVEPLTMDDMGDNESYYWTSDKVLDGDDEQIHIRPKAVANLTMRYYRLPTEIVNDTDESGLSKHWDKAVVSGAVYRLVENASGYQEATVYREAFENAVRKAWGHVRDIGGVKSNTKVKSIYARKRLLGGFRNI